MLRMEKQRREIRDKMEQLKEQRGEFAAVTENMSEGLMVLDGSAAVLSLNESAAKIFGASPKEAVGGNVLALDRSEELQETVSAALGEGGKRLHEQKRQVLRAVGKPGSQGG